MFDSNLKTKHKRFICTPVILVSNIGDFRFDFQTNTITVKISLNRQNIVQFIRFCLCFHWMRNIEFNRSNNVT